MLKLFSLSGFFCGFRLGAPARRGVTFFSGKKESHQRKLPGARERERVRAERSVGPSLRWALGSLIGSQWAMPVTGWFYRSFAKSFTLCLIWFLLRFEHCWRFLSIFYWVKTGEQGRDWLRLLKTTTVCALPNDTTCAHSAGEEKMISPTAMRAAQANQIKQSVKLLANKW